MLKKDNFLWTEAASQDFAELKLALTTAPVLALPNHSLPFVVETDASGSGIGVVLIMQNNHPIAFISKGLAPRHAALSVYERELLALVFAVTKWSHYLLSNNLLSKLTRRPLNIYWNKSSMLILILGGWLSFYLLILRFTIRRTLRM